MTLSNNGISLNVLLYSIVLIVLTNMCFYLMTKLINFTAVWVYLDAILDFLFLQLFKRCLIYLILISAV